MSPCAELALPRGLATFVSSIRPQQLYALGWCSIDPDGGQGLQELSGSEAKRLQVLHASFDAVGKHTCPTPGGADKANCISGLQSWWSNHSTSFQKPTILQVRPTLLYGLNYSGLSTWVLVLNELSMALGIDLCRISGIISEAPWAICSRCRPDDDDIMHSKFSPVKQRSWRLKECRH